MSQREIEIEKLFSGDNVQFFEELSESISLQIKKVFDSKLQDEIDNKLYFSTIGNLDDDNLNEFLQILDANLHPFYSKYNGPKWQVDKLEEMQEPGLIYVWYTGTDNEVICFMSFMMTVSCGLKVIYLYEIHVSPKFQSLKIGTYMINKLHEFSKHLNSQVDSNYKHSEHFLHSGTSLTVFSDNIRALDWYFKLGYDYSDLSPRDKVLRNGKILKPEIYLLTRDNDVHN